MPPKSDCPIDPATNPKCGTLPSIAINAGVNGEFALHSVRMVVPPPEPLI
jgi:hypothetical protein